MPTYSTVVNGQKVPFEANSDEEAVTIADQMANRPIPQKGPAVQRQETRDTGMTGALDAFGRGAADIATFGHADEIAAGLGAVTGVGGDFGEYEKNLNRERAVDKFDEKFHPVARTSGQVAGGVGAAIVAPEMLSARPGLPLVARTAAGATEGAAGGAAYGFGSGEGGLENRLLSARDQAIPGAVFGAGAAAVAPVVNNAFGALLDRWGINPHAPRPSAGAEFEVPLTRGQETGNLLQQRFEEEARQANRGGPAQRVIGGFDERQQQALRDAEERIAQQVNGARVGAPTPPPTNAPQLPPPPGHVPSPPPPPGPLRPLDTRNVNELGQQTLEGVRAAEQRASTNIADAYRRAREAGTTVAAEGIQAAPFHVRQALEQEAIHINEAANPIAAQLLRQLDEFGQLGGILTNRAQYTQRGAGDQITGVTLEGVEQMRRLITSARGANASDDRAIGYLRRAFDRWEQDLSDFAIIGGGEEGLQLFRQARQARADYGRRFESNPNQRDADAGRIMEKLVGTDATAQEVVNAITGVAQVGTKGESTRLVRRLQGVLSPEEFGTVRQLAWERMVQDGAGNRLGPEAIAANLDRLVTGKGADFGRALYPPEVRAMMSRYANLLRQTVPEAGVRNFSGTASPVTRAMNALEGQISSIIGAGMGAQLTGTATGAMVGGGAALAFKGARTGLNWARARGAVSPLPSQPAGPAVLGPAFSAVRPGAAHAVASSRRDEEKPYFYDLPRR